MSIQSTRSNPTGIVEISELPTARVREYARSVGDVYFERKGGRTFLVTDR